VTASHRAATTPHRATILITAAFADAGLAGQLYAADIDSGAAVAVAATAPAPTSSLHKVCLIAALYREAAAGRIDHTRQVEIPAAGRTPGPTGLAVMRDAARLSLRDLASLAVAVSDNVAADILWQHVGIETVNQTMAELGLRQTVAVHTMRDIRDAMTAGAGRADQPDAAPDLTDPAVLARLSVLDPARTSRSTPQDLATLFAAIWRDEVCTGDHARELRSLLGAQAWSHRLASGFPFDDVRVSGKTATLPTLRHEAGVVEYPDGGRYAIAVFSRAASTAAILPAADRAIGRAARIAVDALRAG